MPVDDTAGGGSGDEGGGEDCTFWADADGDGFGYGSGQLFECTAQPEGTVANGDDCDDGDPDVNPDASEVCNSVDDDCDGRIDDEDNDLDPESATTYYADEDADGYGDPDRPKVACEASDAYVATGDDCDDTEARVHPGAKEDCNAVDDNCDGYIDTESACPCDLVREDGRPYLYCEEAKTWAKAESACAELENYALVITEDESEFITVWDTAMRIDSSAWWWLGLHNLDASNADEPDGGWTWVDGTELSWDRWTSGQPDDYLDEDCAHFYGEHGEWNDLPCGENSYDGVPLFYICETLLP